MTVDATCEVSRQLQQKEAQFGLFIVEIAIISKRQFSTLYPERDYYQIQDVLFHFDVSLCAIAARGHLGLTTL